MGYYVGWREKANKNLDMKLRIYANGLCKPEK